MRIKDLTLSLLVLAGLALLPHTALGQPHQPPLQIRFNTPTTLLGACPWYYGRPEGYTGKVPIGFTDAAKADPYYETASLPIGNGSLGASIFGSITTERVSLNEISLWLGGPNTKQGPAHYWDVNKQSAHILPLIRKAFLRGDYRLADSLTSCNVALRQLYHLGRAPHPNGHRLLGRGRLQPCALPRFGLGHGELPEGRRAL